jgi:hypothetical protein
LENKNKNAGSPVTFDFKTSVELFMLDNFSNILCFVKHRKKKLKLIKVTINKIKEHLDALQIIKNFRYLKHIGEKADGPLYEPKQVVSLETLEESVCECFK